tara:strand:- start:1682 stop:3118 length:1437 start_codon:yes stop_codon:yes gene_type:complete
MKRIRKVGITNFILLISSLILVIILIGFSFIRNASSANDIAHTWEVKSSIRQMSATISKMESFGLAYEATGKLKFKHAFQDAHEEYDSLLISLQALIADNDEQVQRLQNISKQMEGNIAIFHNRINVEDYSNSVEKSAIDLHFTADVENKLEELIAVENALLEERNQKFSIWKFIILAALGIATLIVFLSLFNLIKKVKPLIEELLATQTELERANQNMEKTLVELKTLNAEKEEEIRAKEAAISESEKLNESLVAKNQQLDHFAYVASHDLQEPLRTVSNYLEIFQEDFPERLEGEATLYFQFINKAVERMRNLISGLLSFSRLGTSGPMETIDLNATLQKIKEDLDTVIAERGITFSYQTLPTITGYRIEIKQLFQNLISNAIKFTSPNTEPNIVISYEETLNYYNFHISDNGIGIPEKDFSKIFDMFSRLHSTKDYEGQGIGLAFCKKIVELHLGNIWVSSKFGEGTTIHFTLKK